MMVRSEYESGLHENTSFEMRRFNIFLFSSISSLVKLTSELEFEHGTEEIKLETALVDLQFYEQLNAVRRDPPLSAREVQPCA
jgi:hypothetical protein